MAVRIKNKLNYLDIVLLITVFLSGSGYILAKAEKTPLNKIIQGKENIGIEILLPDVPVKNNDYFKTGEKTAITIRNRPYTRLTIIKLESRPKQTILPTYTGTLKTINDPTKLNIKDYYITLSDLALKTNDGYVIGGNKIKIGNQVELEGFDYRLNGRVVNIYSLEESRGP